MLEVQDIKNNLRIDHTLDDGMIGLYLKSVESYVVSAVNSTESIKDMKDTMQYKMAVSLIMQHWHSNRQEASSVRVPTTVTAMIQQLRGKINGNN